MKFHCNCILIPNECMYYIHGFSQPCLILFTSCTTITYDNYNTNGINEAFMINIFATTLQLLMTIIIIISSLYN